MGLKVLKDEFTNNIFYLLKFTSATHVILN